MICDEGKHTTPDEIHYIIYPLYTNGNGYNGSHGGLAYDPFGDGDCGKVNGSGRIQACVQPSFNQFKKIL